MLQIPSANLKTVSQKQEVLVISEQQITVILIRDFNLPNFRSRDCLSLPEMTVAMFHYINIKENDVIRVID